MKVTLPNCSRMHDLLVATQRFAVHVLSEKQVRWNTSIIASNPGLPRPDFISQPWRGRPALVRGYISMHCPVTSLKLTWSLYLLQVHYSVHFSRPVPSHQDQFDSIPHQLGLAVSGACTRQLVSPDIFCLSTFSSRASSHLLTPPLLSESPPHSPPIPLTPPLPSPSHLLSSHPPHTSSPPIPLTPPLLPSLLLSSHPPHSSSPLRASPSSRTAVPSSSVPHTQCMTWETTMYGMARWEHPDHTHPHPPH